MAEVPAAPDAPKSYVDNILETSASRASWTRSFLGESLSVVVEELKKDPYKIDINPDDDNSLVSGVYAFQKHAGFPEEDNKNGCDGIFGPFTTKAFESKTGVKLNIRSLEIKAESREASQELQTEPAAPLLEPVGEASETVNGLEAVTPGQTAFFGDSVAVLVSGRPEMKGVTSICKGAQQTSWVIDKFNKFLAEKKSGKHGDISRVIFLVGHNDVTDPRRNIGQVIGQLEKACVAAKAAGITIVLSTIPPNDPNLSVKYYSGLWAERGWGGGRYPFSANDLAQRREEFNRGILSLRDRGLASAVVPLHEKKYSRGDVHSYGNDASRMAVDVKRFASVVDARVVS